MARNQTTNKGNIPADDRFIEWMQSRDALEILDPAQQEENALPFAAKMRYSDERDAVGSPWMIPPDGRRCKGKAYVRDVDGDYIVDVNNNRIQRPCYNWPMRGMEVCLSHGGGVRRVKIAAVERLASSLDVLTGELVRIGLDPNVPPKDRISAINSAMDRVGLRGGTEIKLEDPGYLDVLRNMFEGAARKQVEEDAA